MDTTTMIKCPHCRTIRSGKTMRNSQFTCKGCSAAICVDNNGYTKWTRLKK